MSRFQNLLTSGLALLSVLILSLPTLASDGWEKNGAYNSHFNVKSMVTLTGTVVSVDRDCVPMPGMSPGFAADLKTAKGETVTVQVGPRWFTNHFRGAWNLQPGDSVTVTGSLVTMGGKKVLMVSQGQKGDLKLTVRARNGAPMWDPPITGF